MLVLPSFIWSLALAALADAQLLGTAADYGVFAATTITNTGNTVVDGNIGLSPGTSITGFNPPGTYTGTQNINNGAATTAKNDIQSAYDSLAGMAAGTDLTGQDLGGMTLQSGVYKFSSSGQLTGTLTLDARGDPNALFVFQFGSTLTTATAASVTLIGGAQACNVYWQVGSSATLGTSTKFVGNILASASITATTGVSNDGGLYALTAAVTLDTNIINAQGNCNGVVASSSTAISSMNSASSTATSSTALSSTLATTSSPVSIVTSTTTVTVTIPASTTTITKTGAQTSTVTKTVSTKYSTCTSTRYSTSTQTKHTTCPTPKCTSTKASASSTKVKRGSPKKTVTKTYTTYCAGNTSTKLQTPASTTHTVSTTHTATSTKWSTSTTTSTSTSTHTPSCTNGPKVRRDHQRMFV